MANKATEPRVPMTLQRSRLKAEEKTLDFEFEVVNVQFNKTGRYALRLTVENLLLEGSGAGVKLRVNEGDAQYTTVGTTDIIEQSNPNEICSFERRKFIFTLPKGFCKNDKNHDVRLRIEALQLRGASMKNSLRAGEAFFAIYPRTNQPRINLFAKKDEDLYRYDDIMALLRVGNDKLAMHCGRLAYSVCFHEHRPPVPKETHSSSHHLSPQPSTKEEGAETPRPSSPMPLKSLGTPLQGHSHVTPGASTDSPRHLPAVDLHTSSPEISKLPVEHDQDSSPDLEDDSADEALASSSSSPAMPRQLPSNASFHLSSPGYSPDLDCQPFSEMQVSESPPEGDESVRTSETNNWHLARPGKDSISVTLHGATNLPPNQRGQAPWPYVIVKTKYQAQNKKEAQGVTHASTEPTYSPTWEEKVTVETDAEDAGHEAVTLTTADKNTKEVLSTYQIPVRYLRPFHHYHFKLMLPKKKDSSETTLYATVVRKSSLIPRYVGMNYTGLEVFLHGVNEPLEKSQGPLIAVARVVNNLNAYKKIMRMRPPASPVVDLTAVRFPNPSLVDFDAPRVTNRGFPQVSHPSNPTEKPSWNTSFLFQGRDGATIFSDDTALVIEYYPHKPMSEMDPENMSQPLGYSILPLTNRVYRKLVAESNRSGIQVENLLIQDTNLQTTSGGIPTIQISLQLVGSERPDVFLTPSNTSTLPSLNSSVLEKLGNIKEPWTQASLMQLEEMAPIETQRKKSYLNLPLLQAASSPLFQGELSPSDLDAFAEPLPDSQIHPYEKVEKPVINDEDNYSRPQNITKEDQDQFPARDTSLPPADAVAKILPLNQKFAYKMTEDRGVGSDEAISRPRDVITHQQDQEPDTYRLALTRMADDILSLRRHVVNLETENSNLRRNLNMHKDLGRTLLDDVDIDVMTKAEIVDRIVGLKQKLAAETMEIRKLKDRVQQLQNELIRKNDMEKDLLTLQRAHQQQQAVLRKYNEKIAKIKALEETVRQQEKVIEKMERLLEGKLAEATKNAERPSGKTFSKGLYTTLLTENLRLQEELGRSHYCSSPIILQQQSLPQDIYDHSERLSLLAKLEKAQTHIHVLESQLEQSARTWGREKQELNNQLMELEHGFRHLPSPVPRDFQVKTSSDPTTHHKRHQTLDPLP
ncbi:coiled-coil domain-containing protein 33-like [Alligator mississippiensis]|uniref:Coiled-coil domain-containing protein 33-like n=1 Tax=Alligator mississippiensis TaxID=8496 RepID=A0A151MAJ4_ALLMI|nr:coiled-coil domain-containing protein 33-like [Alligator mississippiensis]